VVCGRRASVVRAMPSAAEEEVFGISITDPDVLKATQFVLVCVGITAFFLSVELVAVVEHHGLNDFSRFEVIWWTFDMVRCSLLILSGYLGVKKSSRGVLLLFFVLSLVSSIESIAEAIYDIIVEDEAGLVTLQFCESAYFLVAMYYARFLWKRARERSLQDAPSDESSVPLSYSLLGIEMMDIKVLKATQMVFTSLAIVGSILGSFVVRGAEGAATDSSFRVAWLSCVALLLSLGFSGYYGVKKSNPKLLNFFASLSGTLFGLFVIISLLTATACGGQCMTAVFFGFGIAGILGVATKNAIFLKTKALEGTILTAPVSESPAGVAPTQFGVEMGEAPPKEGEDPLDEEARPPMY